MQTFLVLTVIGEDKPGLVESIAQVIMDNSGNWLESSMSQLAGKFAGILRVSVKNEKADNLVSALNNLSQNLKVVIERVDVEQENLASQLVELTLVGNDRPGIIREISGALNTLSVNFEQLTTECTPAPMSGDILFKAIANLTLPRNLDIDVLREDLEKLTDDLIVEINLK
ncbi:MAG: ACT domain-containing protein [Gammaproteobacteria bacterium]|nr:ACT domain-containing protein [Gammaproteobacteria bacterium]